jgi:flap endonuclease-1
MGVNISSIVKGKEIALENMLDKTVGIDAFNWIYQFLSTIRQKDGELLRDFKGRVTSHLSGLFYRTIKLMEAGIKPVYVFDGEVPEMKKKETQKRKTIREEARKEWKHAVKRKDFKAARKYAQQSSQITDEVIESSKALLKTMGIPIIQAFSEAEAQCAVMCRKGDVWTTASQDYDSLIFGSPRLVRNLSITGRKKRGDSYITINPEMIDLKAQLESLGISQDQLIILAILVGTDFNPGGVKGLGPKRALELVREKKTFDRVFKDIEWEHEVEPEKIYEFFRNPKTVDYVIKANEPDFEGIRRLLCDEYDFSEERVGNALKRLAEKPDQKSLETWFKK